MLKREEIIAAFMEKQNAVKHEIGDRVIVQYDEPRNVAVWFGKMRKPVYHYIFDKEERRQEFIGKQVKNALVEQERNEARKKQIEEEHKLFQAGAILVSSWGYEQTNIDFYQILERKPKSVVIQEIGQNKEHDSMDTGTCTPDPETKIGEPMLKKLSKHGGVSLNSYSYCGLWDGRPQRWSSYY